MKLIWHPGHWKDGPSLQTNANLTALPPQIYNPSTKLAVPVIYWLSDKVEKEWNALPVINLINTDSRSKLGFDWKFRYGIDTLHPSKHPPRRDRNANILLSGFDFFAPGTPVQHCALRAKRVTFAFHSYQCHSVHLHSFAKAGKISSSFRFSVTPEPTSDAKNKAPESIHSQDHHWQDEKSRSCVRQVMLYKLGPTFCGRGLRDFTVFAPKTTLLLQPDFSSIGRICGNMWDVLLVREVVCVLFNSTWTKLGTKTNTWRSRTPSTWPEAHLVIPSHLTHRWLSLVAAGRVPQGQDTLQ